MKLVQILLPLYDNHGRKFPQVEFATVREELVAKFGGLTAYTRSPARGLWKTRGATMHDDVVIFEVMTKRVAATWWSRYRRKLERRFRQETVIVRVQEMKLL